MPHYRPSREIGAPSPCGIVAPSPNRARLSGSGIPVGGGRGVTKQSEPETARSGQPLSSSGSSPAKIVTVRLAPLMIAASFAGKVPVKVSKSGSGDKDGAVLA